MSGATVVLMRAFLSGKRSETKGSIAEDEEEDDELLEDAEADADDDDDEDEDDDAPVATIEGWLIVHMALAL